MIIRAGRGEESVCVMCIDDYTTVMTAVAIFVTDQGGRARAAASAMQPDLRKSKRNCITASKGFQRQRGCSLVLCV